MPTNPLTLIPAQYRQYAYALLALAALVITVWQASDGNWRTALVSLVVALSHTTAASNTKRKGSVGAGE